MIFMVKVNILQLLTVYVLQFIIKVKTLHLLSSFHHWECRSGSGHGYQISSDDDENNPTGYIILTISIRTRSH